MTVNEELYGLGLLAGQNNEYFSPFLLQTKQLID